MRDCKTCHLNNVVKYKENVQDLSKDTYVMAGKIKMFYDIVKQVDAFEGIVSEDFKGVMKELYKILEKEINVFGIPSGNEFIELTLNELRYKISQW